MEITHFFSYNNVSLSLNKTIKLITIAVLVFFLTAIASGTYGQKFSISPKIGWHGLVIFSPEESVILTDGVNIFTGPSTELDFYYQATDYISFRLNTSYLWGLPQKSNHPLIPEQEITYSGRGLYLSPSIFIKSATEKRISPFIGFGVLTGMPEMVFNYKDDKTIYTGDILLGLTSSIGAHINLNKAFDLQTEFTFNRARYSASKQVSKSNDNVIVSELDKEDSFTPNFQVQQVNFSIGLIYSIGNERNQ